MSLFKQLFQRRAATDFGRRAPSQEDLFVRAEPPSAQDTRAAIEELSQVVKNNPEAVEIYLALGNLYRSQGEIERAIQIRNNLIVRRGLDSRFKARALLELGRDFRRGGFLDRSSQSLQQARDLVGDQQEVLLELAELAAQSGEFERAAELYGDLGLPLVKAHYLVRLSGEKHEAGDMAQGQRLIKRALKAYPGSVEAWLERLVQTCHQGSAARLADTLREALEHVPGELQFLLLEGLAAFLETGRRGVLLSPGKPMKTLEAPSKELCANLVKVLEDRPPDVLLCYYGARILLDCGEADEARSWLEKALVLSPEFWLARLDLFELAKSRQVLTPFFEEQLDFFIGRARHLRRFICSQCGLKRESIFFICPRCRSWHSIVFRKEFN